VSHVNVLIVEDEPRIAGFLAKGLRRQGYEVRCAYTGAEAIELAGDETRVPPIDLVVLDLGLPDIDGLDVMRALRERGSEVPILVLTARTEASDRAEAFRLGAVEYLAKPQPFPNFLDRVQASLRGD
jgi:two-component system, OmpR family, copper resistance phosphate regulon response regulator CusR